METLGSLHVHVGKPYQRDKILIFPENRQDLEFVWSKYRGLCMG